MRPGTGESLVSDPKSAKDSNGKGWRADKAPALLAAGLVACVFSIVGGTILATGGRIVTGGETSAVLTSQIAEIKELNRDQNVGLKEQNKLLQEILLKQAQLYTREEARADREAAERRFQSLESRIGDMGRRLESVESGQRTNQLIIDKFLSGRK
jgi:hypothetical protein